MGERPRRILSIDGGGVRGVIAAVALAALERRTGRPVRDQFDFVAGTSTGALIAAGVATGVPADQIVALYLERAPELFRQVPVISTLARVVTGHMYDVDRLHRLIRSELGSAADWRLADVPIDILITAKGLLDSHQWYFVRDCQGRNTCRTGNLALADCLTASAAAPTYFAPWTIPGLAERGPMVDGGTGVAGNPTYQACVEAFLYAEGYRPEETVVVSLGTGRYLAHHRPGWLYDWLGWLLAELLRSPSEQQTELVSRHFGAATFYRIDARLERDYPLDGVGEMGALRAIGERLAEQVDWPAVLEGSDARWRVHAGNRLPSAYTARV